MQVRVQIGWGWKTSWVVWGQEEEDESKPTCTHTDVTLCTGEVTSETDSLTRAWRFLCRLSLLSGELEIRDQWIYQQSEISSIPRLSFLFGNQSGINNAIYFSVSVSSSVTRARISDCSDTKVTNALREAAARAHGGRRARWPAAARCACHTTTMCEREEVFCSSCIFSSSEII